MHIQKIRKKLNSKAGFNLAETLMTVLLMTIVLSAITAGIEAARRAYRNVRMKSDAQMLLATTITELSAEYERARYLNGSDALPAEGASIVNYFSEYRGGWVRLGNAGAAKDKDDQNVGIVIGGVAEDYSVTSSTDLAKEDNTSSMYSLVNRETRGLDTLYTRFVPIDWDSTSNENPPYTLPVYKTDGYIEFRIQVCNEQTGSNDQPLADQVVCIRPVLCM